MLQDLLSQRDLADPDQGPHALQILTDNIQRALAEHWNCPLQVHRGSPIVNAADHYRRLGYSRETPNATSHGVRHLTDTLLLRVRTAAAIPPLLRAMATNPPDDLLLVCPGMAYRQGAGGALHASCPHLLDLWRVTSTPLGTPDQGEMVQTAMRTALPGVAYRLLPASVPYMTHCMRIDALHDEAWIEIGKCGVVTPEILATNGLDPTGISALTMVLGLDRLLMVRKAIPDIRLLRSEDVRIAQQMLDLQPFEAPRGTEPTTDSTKPGVREATMQENMVR